MNLSRLIARIKVILAAAVTWLLFIGLLLGQLAGDVGDLGPIGADISTWALRLVAWIGTAVLIIRRVTPVIDRAERGILPVDAPNVSPTPPPGV